MKLMTSLVFLMIAIYSHAEAFESYSLEHQDILEFSDMHTTALFTVNYPGLDFSRTQNNNEPAPDCFVVQTSQFRPTKEILSKLSEKIFLADGPGVLFNTGQREVNPLTPTITRNRAGKWVVKFFLKDLHTYVTGIRIASFSPYISIQQIVEQIFGDNSQKVRLQFLRNCSI